MARPQRNNVDYFPFICEEGTKMFYIEETYGNDGFAVFVKLLRELARADNHYLDLSKKSTKMFLSAKCKVSVGVLEAIVTDLVELEKFDTELWNENSIVWCQSFVDSVQDAYSKRSNKCIDRKTLLLLLESKGIRKPSKSNPKPSLDKPKGDVNPQSIVKYSKEEESIIKNTDILYSIYPSKTIRDGKECRTKSADKNKKKIAAFLSKKEHTFESLKKCIEAELNGKDIKEGIYQYLKNLDQFLNNLPDINTTDKDPNDLDDNYIYFQWKREPSIMARRVLKTEAKDFFEGQACGGYEPKFLKHIKNKSKTWN